MLRTPGTVSSKMRHFQSKVKGGPENTLMTSAFRLTAVIRRYLTYLCKQQFSIFFSQNMLSRRICYQEKNSYRNIPTQFQIRASPVLN